MFVRPLGLDASYEIMQVLEEAAQVEVKIGVQFAARELVLESTESAAEVEQAVMAAVSDESGVLTLTDDKGRKVLVPAGKLAYVEIGPETATRRVGFAAS
ncbi:DUF3107 domain-containing protein [Fodinicola feengrottensis]|uniref:DUF3107 domain-containing protein n=1 Tax=Fodinicola feengrottensis TaxID=435914 RepID=A0ABN2IIQ0_9ACTN